MQPNVVGCRFTVITRSLKLALGTTRASSVASKISRFRTGLSRAVALILRVNARFARSIWPLD